MLQVERQLQQSKHRYEIDAIAITDIVATLAIEHTEGALGTDDVRAANRWPNGR